MEMVCQWLDECKMSNEGGGHMMYVTQLIVHSLLYCFVRDKSYSMFICLFSYYYSLIIPLRTPLVLQQ